MKFSDVIPQHLKAFLGADFLSLSAAEPQVDCRNCTMSQKGIYKKELKCCTFYPFLANFTIHAILQLGTSGAESVKDKIKNHCFATPLGLVAPSKYQMKYTFKSAESFGQDDDLLCPYFADGGCSIWSWRSSECAGFSCMYRYGEEGKEAWSLLTETLYDVECFVAQELMLQKGFHWEEVEQSLSWVRQSSSDLQERLGKECSVEDWSLDQLSEEEWCQLWGHHSQNPLGYYKEVFELSRQLSEKDLSQDLKKKLQTMTAFWLHVTGEE